MLCDGGTDRRDQREGAIVETLIDIRSQSCRKISISSALASVAV